jgi:hypothetical protein
MPNSVASGVIADCVQPPETPAEIAIKAHKNNNLV